MDDPRSDNELMLGVRGGDLHALGLLFSRHRERVHALCRRMTGDPALADDLVQETFLRILKYGHGFQGNARFTTWMYRIARNATIRQLERDSSRDEKEAIASHEFDHQRPAGPSDLTEQLGEVLAQLPAEQREVLILSRYHDLRYSEIAEVCECSVAAVKARVYRAMRTLREQMRTMEQSNEQLRAGEK